MLKLEAPRISGPEHNLLSGSCLFLYWGGSLLTQQVYLRGSCNLDTRASLTEYYKGQVGRVNWNYQLSGGMQPWEGPDSMSAVEIASFLAQVQEDALAQEAEDLRALWADQAESISRALAEVSP